MGLFGKKKKSKPLKEPEVLTDKHLKGAKSLGNDTANQVYKTQYKSGTGIGGSREGYFKGDSEDTTARYAVGASSLAKGMGLGHLIPETRYATHSVKDADGNKHKKQFGAVSAGAKGDALASNVFDTDQTQDVKANYDQMRGHGIDTTMDKQAVDKGYKKRQGKKKSDVSYMGMSGAELNEVDLSDPAIQQQLNHLQWFDALIGNTDRHAGNILVDSDTKQVKGIDNDMAFGRGITAKFQNGDMNEEFEKGAEGKYLGLPAQIDQDMADKLLGLDDDTIKEILTSGGPDHPGATFSDDDLQSTYDRLAVIKAKVQGMVDNDQVLDGWDRNTYQSALGEDRDARKNFKNTDGFGSYAQRHHFQMQEAMDTNNPQAWRKGHRTGDTTPSPKPAVPDRSTKPALRPKPTAKRTPPPVPPQSAKPNRTIPRPAPPSMPPLPPTPSGGGTATKTAPTSKPVLDRLKGTPFEGM
ncbi:MAG: hypothetical protein U5K29_03220 [Acidimicrobiales bacterium]|nr:hypothetical protein [Acidimicrobiales bacterium]